jgi:thiamine transport system permease protein
MAQDRRLAIRHRIGIVAAVPVVAFVATLIMLPTLIVVVNNFELRNLIDALGDSRIRHVIWISIWQSSVSTAIALVVGFPIASVLARYSFPGRRAVSALVTLPFVLPSVVVAIAALSISGGKHPLLVIVLTHSFFNVSVVVRILRPHLSTTIKFDNAAALLGAGPLRRLFTNDLHLASRSLQQAAVAVFIFCFTSFGVVRILGGLSGMTSEVEIYVRAIQLGDMKTAVSLAMLQTVFLIAIVAIFRVAEEPRRTLTAISSQRRQLSLTNSLLLCTASFIFVLPIGVVIVKSLRVRNHWTTSGWAEIDFAVITRSITFAGVAALLAVCLSILLVIAIAYMQSGGRILNAIGSLPIVISAIVLGVGVIGTFNSGWMDFRGATWLLPTMHSIVALPICFRILRGPLSAITTDHRDAACTLGASPVRTLFTLDLGSLRQAIPQAAVLAGCVSLGEFGATSVLSRNDTRTIPMEITRLLSRPGNTNQLQAYALAVILLVIVGLAAFSVGGRDA